MRDVEFRGILDKMAGKGLVVFVVLDNCYSGGATRIGNESICGVDGCSVPTQKYADHEDFLRHSKVNSPVNSEAVRHGETNATRDVVVQESWWQPGWQIALNYTFLPVQKYADHVNLLCRSKVDSRAGWHGETNAMQDAVVHKRWWQNPRNYTVSHCLRAP